MPYVFTQDLRVYYEHEGSGHPLLLIPGVGYGGWFWGKVAPALGQRYQVILPDPRGVGKTDKPAGPYSVHMMAEDAAQLLDKLHVRGAFVVGHALGGYVAQQLALDRPELVGKLVLAAANFGGPNVVPITKEAYEVLTEREASPEDLLRRAIEVATGPGFAERQPDVVQELIDYRLAGAAAKIAYRAQAAAEIAMAPAEASFEERLAEIGAPTLILFGQHDRVTPPGNAELLAARIPNAQVAILPDVGHLFPIEDPEATVSVLTDFFGSRRYSPGA